MSSLVQSAELIAKGGSSATKLLENALEAISAQEPVIHAWETLDEQGARLAAAEADRRISRRQMLSPLDGLPIGIKDIIDTAHVRTSYGSALYSDHVPKADAHIVTALRESGAVIVGKTVTTEFATFDPPATRNPWNPAHTPGGSSSGSAASVAAGMVPAAIGSQTAGSTIRPASYCGIAGYMPSPGWIGRTGIYPCSWSLDRVGLLATTSSDLPLLLRGCLGVDENDPVSKGVRLSGREPTLPRTAGVLATLLDHADPEMRHAVERAADLMAQAGVKIAVVSVDVDVAHAAHMTILKTELASVHADAYARASDSYAPGISELVEGGLAVEAVDYLRALRFRRKFRREVTLAQKSFDVFLAPAAIGAAEADLTTIGHPFMNLLATFAGLPAVTFPAALSSSGLPLGLQMIGRQDDDEMLLAMAAAADAAIGLQK